MIDLKFNIGEFEARTKELGGQIDQMPYALAQAMNAAAKATRERLAGETWPKHVNARNRTFMRAALRTEFASKQNLRVSIYDALKRGSLALHDKGGTKQARTKLAIPSKRVQQRRSAKGVPPNLRPRNLKNAVVKGNLIFQSVGRGKAKKLQLMYALRPQARIKPDVPFTRDFQSYMLEYTREAFPITMALAMKTRRK